MCQNKQTGNSGRLRGKTCSDVTVLLLERKGFFLVFDSICLPV